MYEFLKQFKILRKIVQFIRIFWAHHKHDLVYFKFYLYNYIISYFPSCHIRHCYLKYILGYHLGKHAFVHLGCYFYGNDIKIGDGSVVGRNCQLCGNIEIGKNTSITAFSYIQSISHDKNCPGFKAYESKIIIEDNAWIGGYAMIICGGQKQGGVVMKQRLKLVRVQFWGQIQLLQEAYQHIKFMLEVQQKRSAIEIQWHANISYIICRHLINI